MARKLIQSTLVTLNGVVTNQAQWAGPYFDADAKRVALESLAASDLFLLGRRTYDEFSPVWPQLQDDEYFAAVNAMKKVVLSNTLETATWNTSVLRGNAAENVRALKRQPGKHILKYGMTALDRALVEERLIDEFHFSIHPIVVPEGVRLFDGIDTSGMTLDLIGTRRFASGVVQLSYQPKWR